VVIWANGFSVPYQPGARKGDGDIRLLGFGEDKIGVEFFVLVAGFDLADDDELIGTIVKSCCAGDVLVFEWDKGEGELQMGGTEVDADCYGPIIRSS
jgi:hypothetical protein